jgi:hypothetical protein
MTLYHLCFERHTKVFIAIYYVLEIKMLNYTKNLKRAFLPFNSIKTFRAEEYKMSVFIGITQHKEIMLHEDIFSPIFIDNSALAACL